MEKEHEAMNICYAADHKYAPILAASIASLFRNNPDREINIHVLDSGLTEEDRVRLTNLVSKFTYGGGGVIFINTDDIITRVKEMGLPPFTGNYATYTRLAIGEVMPDSTEKILYLDADMLIRGNISSFYDEDLSGKICAGVQDLLSGEYYTQNGLPADYAYINAGVLLINLEEWRKHFSFEKIKEILLSLKALKYADQDIINPILFREGGAKIISPVYNLFAVYYDWDMKHMLRQYPKISEMLYGAEEIREAMKDPVIVHLVEGIRGRPWQKGNSNPFSEEWMSCLKETEFFADFVPFSYGGIKHKILVAVYRIMPQCLSSLIIRMRKKMRRVI